MQRHPRSARKRLRELMVLAPAGALLMAACGGGGGVDLTATLRSEGAAVRTAVADIEISSDATSICWEIQGLVGTVGDVTTMHIHAGNEGDIGPVVVDFISGNQACKETSPGGHTEAALRDIAAEPARFYVDVHSELHPYGVVRGQLEPMGGGK